jgi:hypothetical protein
VLYVAVSKPRIHPPSGPVSGKVGAGAPTGASDTVSTLVWQPSPVPQRIATELVPARRSTGVVTVAQAVGPVGAAVRVVATWPSTTTWKSWTTGCSTVKVV